MPAAEPKIYYVAEPNSEGELRILYAAYHSHRKQESVAKGVLAVCGAIIGVVLLTLWLGGAA